MIIQTIEILDTEFATKDEFNKRINETLKELSKVSEVTDISMQYQLSSEEHTPYRGVLIVYTIDMPAEDYDV